MRNAYSVLVGKCLAGCPLGRLKLINMKVADKTSQTASHG